MRLDCGHQWRMKPKHGATFLLLGFLLLGSYWFQFRINVTESLPHYLYFVAIKGAPQKNGYVVFSHPTFAHKLIKKVVGVEGDTVEIRDNKVFVAYHPIGALQDKNSHGEPLVPIQTKAIPKGYYFVMGDHKRSFDSRYQFFGLVHQSQIEGRAWPLF